MTPGWRVFLIVTLCLWVSFFTLVLSDATENLPVSTRPSSIYTVVLGLLIALLVIAAVGGMYSMLRRKLMEVAVSLAQTRDEVHNYGDRREAHGHHIASMAIGGDHAPNPTGRAKVYRMPTRRLD
jgi:hypothetical protein